MSRHESRRAITFFEGAAHRKRNEFDIHLRTNTDNGHDVYGTATAGAVHIDDNPRFRECASGDTFMLLRVFLRNLSDDRVPYMWFYGTASVSLRAWCTGQPLCLVVYAQTPDSPLLRDVGRLCIDAMPSDACDTSGCIHPPRDEREPPALAHPATGVIATRSGEKHPSTRDLITFPRYSVTSELGGWVPLSVAQSVFSRATPGAAPAHNFWTAAINFALHVCNLTETDYLGCETDSSSATEVLRQALGLLVWVIPYTEDLVPGAACDSTKALPADVFTSAVSTRRLSDAAADCEDFSRTVVELHRSLIETPVGGSTPNILRVLIRTARLYTPVIADMRVRASGGDPTSDYDLHDTAVLVPNGTIDGCMNASGWTSNTPVTPLVVDGVAWLYDGRERNIAPLPTGVIEMALRQTAIPSLAAARTCASTATAMSDFYVDVINMIVPDHAQPMRLVLNTATTYGLPLADFLARIQNGTLRCVALDDGFDRGEFTLDKQFTPHPRDIAALTTGVRALAAPSIPRYFGNSERVVALVAFRDITETMIERIKERARNVFSDNGFPVCEDTSGVFPLADGLSVWLIDAGAPARAEPPRHTGASMHHRGIEHPQPVRATVDLRALEEHSFSDDDDPRATSPVRTPDSWDSPSPRNTHSPPREFDEHTEYVARPPEEVVAPEDITVLPAQEEEEEKVQTPHRNIVVYCMHQTGPPPPHYRAIGCGYYLAAWVKPDIYTLRILVPPTEAITFKKWKFEACDWARPAPPAPPEPPMGVMPIVRVNLDGVTVVISHVRSGYDCAYRCGFYDSRTSEFDDAWGVMWRAS